MKKLWSRTLRATLALAMLAFVLQAPAQAATRLKPSVILHSALTAEFLVYTPEMWINQPNFLSGELRLTDFGCIYFHSNEDEDMAAIFAPGTTWKNQMLTMETFDNQDQPLDPTPVRLGRIGGRQVSFFGSAERLQNMAFRVTRQCLPSGADRVAILWGQLESVLTPEQRAIFHSAP
ncbi:MAG: hypothetical protein RL672_911 [Actinomycetota bacterium]